MAKFVSMAIGLALMGLGVWALVAWWDAFLVVLRAGVAVLAVLLGLGVFVFGLSELWSGPPKSALPPPAAAMPEGPGEPA